MYKELLQKKVNLDLLGVIYKNIIMHELGDIPHILDKRYANGEIDERESIKSKELI